MYEFTLAIHNLLRWAVLATGVWAAGRALTGWVGGRPWVTADTAATRWFVLAISVQFLVGLLLWAALSPFGIAGLLDVGMGEAMRDATRRFWAVEHLTLMLLALALVHVGAARARRATNDGARHRTTALFFVLAVIFVLAGVPWTGTLARPWIRWFF